MTTRCRPRTERLAAPAAGHTLVIGYGNDLRCDDGAGIRAARLIGAQAPQARVITALQLTPDLAADIAAADAVIFVDAYAAHQPGAPLRVDKISGAAAGSVSALGHHGDPATLLQLADRLFGKTPEAWIVGIPAYVFSAGEIISSATEHAIDSAVAFIGTCAFCGKSKGDRT